MLAAERAIGSGATTAPDQGSARLRATNEQIVAGYRALADLLTDQGERNLGGYVRMFADRIQYPSTHQEQEREQVRELKRQRGKARNDELVR
jgi:hypothetical protein